ncbi:hypothetical protein IGI41_002482 [Enterococcus sp. DIV0876]
MPTIRDNTNVKEMQMHTARSVPPENNSLSIIPKEMVDQRVYMI